MLLDRLKRAAPRASSPRKVRKVRKLSSLKVDFLPPRPPSGKNLRARSPSGTEFKAPRRALDHESIPSSRLKVQNQADEKPNTIAIQEADDVNATADPIAENYAIPLSPARALRVAMMKTRFADTIRNAQEKLISLNPVKAQIEAAARKKEEEAKLRQRQRERQAAKMKLEMMEKTVVINEYDELMQELKSIGYTLVPHVPFPIPRGL